MASDLPPHGNGLMIILRYAKKRYLYLKQFLKSHPWFLLKLKFRQKMKYGLNFFQDHFHCLGLFSRHLGYFSQNGQDYFLDKYIFNGKNNGYFVDIGTFEPIFDNATYFFEKNRSWKGVAIEPQLAHVQNWKNQRSTPVVHAAASSEVGSSSFVVVRHPTIMNYNAWSGLKSTIADEKMDILPEGAERSLIDTATVSVSHVLKEQGIKDVDYLSIDVEGHEMEVLKGIDFNAYNFKCIVIENDIMPEGDPKIHQFIIDKGYQYIARLTSDDIFIKV